MDSIALRNQNIRTKVRTGIKLEDIKQDLAENLLYVVGKPALTTTPYDCYLAVAYAVRDRMLHHWVNTVEAFFAKKIKATCYFSAEFLTGPQLGQNLINLDLYDTMEAAIKDYGLDLKTLMELEAEPGLGNGGLGRLAACYMDSLATLGVPAIGFGIRYEFGIFNQQIKDGWQVEYTDKWLRLGNPWEIPRPERVYDVKLGGRTENFVDADGCFHARWIPGTVVRGMAYDTPIPGYKAKTASMLRLWKAEAPESFDFADFNRGDYYGAVESKVAAENITKVLYPNDEVLHGKKLRLQQQYFFVSCSLQNLLEMHLLKAGRLDNLHESYAAQLNDTHPAIAIAELMRLLMDEHHMKWQQAWDVTEKTFSYTNHTLLSEALEKWSVPLFASVLPRHLEIIYEINHRFLEHVTSHFSSEHISLDQLSLIDESGEKYIRMANLACVGSNAINGVSELHTDLLKQQTLKDFYTLYPEKFHNITNGVTPRRWLVLSNPRLTSLISSKIGDSWIDNLSDLKQLEAFADDSDFQKKWDDIKRDNKRDQLDYIYQKTKVKLDPDSLFDVQVKRIHEYKRQHLNILHVITLYHRIKKYPDLNVIPRTFVFAGKAAPGYRMAKLIIKLINSVAEVVNNDADIGDKLKIVFIPNFNVKVGQRIYPIADLSEQISTAGFEASGTGNMKFSMNGALTVGTLDGANIEIRNEVGGENFFLFGLTAEQAYLLKAGGYNPYDYYLADLELREAIDAIASGTFSHGDTKLFKPFVDSLLYNDPYLLLADYRSYVDCQERVGQAWRDRRLWTQKSILNVARMGKFSSDRAIKEYCEHIWKITEKTL